MIDNPLLRFVFRLGLALGKVDPVNEILGVLDARQLAYWQAFLDVEPLAADRADVRDALHTAILANRLGLSDENDAIHPSDLVVDWHAAVEPVSVDPVAEADALLLQIGTLFPV